VALLLGSAGAQAATYTVDIVADDIDAHDINPGDGICRDALNACTLRAAIEESNAGAGVDTIVFSDTFVSEQGKGRFTASIILAGQIKGMEPRLFLIYPEGNFIEASWDTPFFQIGETKYGRPILIRGYDRELSFEDAVKLLIVSFDSTLKANLSVGLPLDLMVIERDAFAPTHERRIEASDEYFQAVSSTWSEALRNAFHSLPDYSFYSSDEG
jgi:putative proteasome-type protease